MIRRNKCRWLWGFIWGILMFPWLNLLAQPKTFLHWRTGATTELYLSSPNDTLFVQGSINLNKLGKIIHDNGVVVFTDTFQKVTGLGSNSQYLAKNEAELVFTGKKGYIRLPGDSARRFIVKTPNWDDTLTLGSTFWVQRHLKLVKGRVIASSSPVRVLVLDARTWDWTAPPITGPADSGYVIGPIDWYWDENFYASLRSILFPVGDDTAYRPIQLIFPNSQGMPVGPVSKRVRFQHIQANPNGIEGTGIDSLSNLRYWKGTLVLGTWDDPYDSVKVRIYAGPDDTALYGYSLPAWRIAKSDLVSGIYNSLGGVDRSPGKLCTLTTRKLQYPFFFILPGEVYLALGSYGCKAGPIVTAPTDKPCQGDTVLLTGKVLYAEKPVIQWYYQWDTSATLYKGGNDTVEYAGAVWDTLYYYFEVKDTVNGCVPDTARDTIFPTPSLKANLVVVLEGAYDQSQNRMVPESAMIAHLRKVYMPGTGYTSSVDSMFPGYEPLAVSSGDSAIDVIWVYLRSTPSGATIDSAMAWLIEDGSVRDFKTSTRPFVNFGCDTSSGNFYIVVTHRNHLPVMSNSAISLNTSDNPPALDFTNSANLYVDPTVLNPPLISIGTTKALYGGNVTDLPGEIPEVNAYDYFLTYIKNGVFTGYAPEDTRLNGSVNASDYNLTSKNNDELYRTHVPNAPVPPRETIDLSGGGQ